MRNAALLLAALFAFAAPATVNVARAQSGIDLVIAERQRELAEIQAQILDVLRTEPVDQAELQRLQGEYSRKSTELSQLLGQYNQMRRPIWRN